MNCPKTLRLRIAMRSTAAMPFVLTVALCGRVQSAPLALGAGTDYYTDSKQQVTRAALVIGAASLHGADGFVAGVRFDSNVVGAGYGLTAGSGVPLGARVQLRVSGARFIADGDYRAWRIKAGPALLRAGRPWVGLYYTHEENNTAPRNDGLLGECEMPLAHGLGVRASAGFAKNANGDGGALGTIGGSWSAMRHLESSLEVGLAQNLSVESGQLVPGPHRPTEGLPLLGSPVGPSNRHASSTTSGGVASVLLGLRVSFP